MPHDFDDLIADLDAAKAGLARSVKRCRTLIGDRRVPPLRVEEPEPGNNAFGWADAEKR
jgi:hypothetical protein